MDSDRTSIKKQERSYFVWLSSYFIAFVIAEVCIASWFYFGKDINNIPDPVGWDAVNAFTGRLALGITFSVFAAFIGPIVAWVVQLAKKKK